LQPLVELDAGFLIIDGIVCGVTERNPPESLLKFIY
jgi:hypothetical protein